jgi:hypothetical protein
MARAGFTNLKQFKVQLKQFEKLTEAEAVKLLKKVALQVLTGVVEKTPVDTGRARANWQVSIGSAGDGEAAQGADPISAGLAKLSQVKPFSTVVVYNNVEYIVALENGHSTQAPQGMVKLTIAEVESQFN